MVLNSNFAIELGECKVCILMAGLGFTLQNKKICTVLSYNLSVQRPNLMSRHGKTKYQFGQPIQMHYAVSNV